MTVTMIGRRDLDGRSDRAMNSHSHVGDTTFATVERHSSGVADPDLLHASEESTIARRVHRGAWRRPHTHHTRAEVLGLAMWWLLVSAVAIGSMMFVARQP